MKMSLVRLGVCNVALLWCSVNTICRGDVYWANTSADCVDWVSYIYDWSDGINSGSEIRTVMVTAGNVLDRQDYEGWEGVWEYYYWVGVTSECGGNSGGGNPTPYGTGNFDFYSWPQNALVSSYTRTELEEELGALIRGSEGELTPAEKQMLDYGCIGVALMLIKHTLPNGVEQFISSYPESSNTNVAPPAKFGTIKGFKKLAQAQAQSCGSGYRTVIFARTGRWKNNTPPQEISGGESGQIPLDSVINYTDEQGTFAYFTLINGKWVTMNRGVGQQGLSQTGKISDSPPVSATNDTTPVIWFRRCVPN